MDCMGNQFPFMGITGGFSGIEGNFPGTDFRFSSYTVQICLPSTYPPGNKKMVLLLNLTTIRAYSGNITIPGFPGTVH